MNNGLVSIVIPSRNEKYLQRTIEDLLQKAQGEIEVIAVLDGYRVPADEVVADDRVHYHAVEPARGMRNAINEGVARAKGEYILKVDAHCMFRYYYDTDLKNDCSDDWVVVPRRLRLNPELWELTDAHKPPVDYMYLSHPEDESVWGGKGLQGKEWREKNLMSDRFPEIDDLMTSQGSCWFMKKSYYEFLELMDEEHYGQFSKEMQEIGLKCWLSGGQMKVNKKTWYAHWHKPKEAGRGYSLSNSEFLKGSAYTMEWFTKDRVWKKQTLPFTWLVEKFHPPGWERNA